jgi:hypothetical protein
VVEPRVFISHATADQDRFVRDFDLRLRSDGVNTWYAGWALRPGDSLVQKIFDEGLATADVVIVVLSANSVDSRWVNEELGTAKILQIQGTCRLIPVVLDGVAVPTALIGTKWCQISDVTAYEKVYDEIVSVIHNRVVAPPLGSPPKYFSGPKVAGLTPAAAVVLIQLGDRVLATDSDFFGSTADFDVVKAQTGLNDYEFRKAMLRLGRDNYIEIHERRPGGNGEPSFDHGKLLPKGLWVYLSFKGYDLDASYRGVVSALVNTPARSITDLAEQLNERPIVVELILRRLRSRRLILMSEFFGEFNSVVSQVDPLLEDELD